MSLVISDKHRYIFFHLPKNAGVSISSYLIAQEVKLRLKKSINYLTPYIFGKKNNFYITKEKKFYNFNSHITCYNFFALINEKSFKNYFKFAVVRNPFDRAVSRYEYSKKIQTRFKNFSFEEFLIFDLKNNLHTLKQYEFCTYDKNKLILDKIIKFENLNEEFNEVTNTLFKKNHNIKHLNKTKRNNYREYFNSNTIKLIEKNLYKDLEYFNYEF